MIHCYVGEPRGIILAGTRLIGDDHQNRDQNRVAKEPYYIDFQEAEAQQAIKWGNINLSRRDENIL